MGVPVVVAEEGVGEGVVGIEVEALVPLDLGDVPGVHLHDHVGRVEEQGLGEDVLVREGLQDHAIEVGAALVVGRVGLHDHVPFVRHLAELEGTASHGALDEGVVAGEEIGSLQGERGHDLEGEPALVEDVAESGHFRMQAERLPAVVAADLQHRARGNRQRRPAAVIEGIGVWHEHAEAVVPAREIEDDEVASRRLRARQVGEERRRGETDRERGHAVLDERASSDHTNWYSGSPRIK